MDAARKYHHGNLKEAFLKAARDLLERDGLGGLSLRSANAPKRWASAMQLPKTILAI